LRNISSFEKVAGKMILCYRVTVCKGSERNDSSEFWWIWNLIVGMCRITAGGCRWSCVV